jgi:hypothetical protein
MTSFSTLHLPKTIQTIPSKIALPGSLMNVPNVQVIAHRVLYEWDSTLRAARRHACTHIAITQSNHPTDDYSTCERGEWQKGSSIGRGEGLWICEMIVETAKLACLSLHFVCLWTSQDIHRGVPHAGQDSTKSVMPLALHWHWEFCELMGGRNQNKLGYRHRSRPRQQPFSSLKANGHQWLIKYLASSFGCSPSRSRRLQKSNIQAQNWSALSKPNFRSLFAS